ncbi:MAG TPA: methionine--tRNA ligase [bacterium]|jgi:methionyl-tRNA synthetase
MTNENKIFGITTPLYYVNARWHLGHAYSTFVCDTLTRFHKVNGYETFFVTGSDEHGVKVKEAAEAKGVTPIQWADEIVEHGKSLWERCGIEYDYFVRTTQREPEDHYADVQRLFKRIYDHGDIYLGEYEGLYCKGCEQYYTEKELEDGKCPIHETEPVVFKEPCLFFKLSKWAPVLLEMLQENPYRIRPESRHNEIVSKLKSGVDDLAVSRTRLDWGIPLDNVEKGHVCYVWFDALLGYATANGLGEWLDEVEKYEADNSYALRPTHFAKFWPNTTHIIAKDILWFHTVIFPAMLLAAELWPGDHKKLVSAGSYAHGYLLERGRKMSKSLGNILDPDPYLELLGSDALRFYLLREVSFGDDGSINHEAIAERTNADLANDLGNLLHRTLSMLDKDCDGKVPVEGPHNEEFVKTAKAVHDDAVQAIADFAPHKALESIWDLVRLANRNIEETKPWELRKEGKTNEVEAFLYDQVQALHNLAILLYPFIPKLTQKIWEQLGLPGNVKDQPYSAGATWGTIEPLTQTKKGDPIVPRIDIAEFLDSVDKLQHAKTAERAAPAKSKYAPIKEQIEYDDFAKCDFRIATIIEAEPVRKADKLLKLQIDLGLEKRQIVAGIAQHYKPEDLIGKQIVVVANLKPVTLRGEESRGMLLASGDSPVLLAPIKDVTPGDTVR